MEKTKTKKPVKQSVIKTAKPIDKKEMKNGIRTLSGKVVSTKMQNTVVVAIERKVAHKLYGKLIKVTKRLKADTNGMEINEGDFVKIVASKPISKDKNYKVIAKEGSK